MLANAIPISAARSVIPVTERDQDDHQGRGQGVLHPPEPVPAPLELSDVAREDPRRRDHEVEDRGEEQEAGRRPGQWDIQDARQRPVLERCPGGPPRAKTDTGRLKSVLSATMAAPDTR